jgi:hypothetical protein
MSTQISKSRLAYMQTVAKTVSGLFDQLGDCSCQSPHSLSKEILQIAKKKKTRHNEYVFIDKSEDIKVQVIPYSPDMGVNAYIRAWNTFENYEFEIEIFLDTVLRTKLPLKDKIYALMMHELTHIFGEWGTSPKFIRESSWQSLSKIECQTAYLTNLGEIHAHAMEAASLYCMYFKNQPYKTTNMMALIVNGSNSNFVDYMISFKLNDYQIMDCLNGVPLKIFRTKFLTNLARYIDRLNRIDISE